MRTRTTGQQKHDNNQHQDEGDNNEATPDDEDDPVYPITTATASPTTVPSNCLWGGDGKRSGWDNDGPDPSATSNCLWGRWLVCQTRRYNMGNSEDRDDREREQAE